MTTVTPLVHAHAAIGDFTIRDVIEGQTAGQLIVAADDWGWWTTLLGGDTIEPSTGIQQTVALGLVRAGFLARRGHRYHLTHTGHDVGKNRGFVRCAVRGWEPTFRQLSAAADDEYIPAATEPGEVARACTDIARRRPEIFATIGASIAADIPGCTIDLGCADAGRVQALAGLAPRERFLGVDIEDEVIDAATGEVTALGLADRITLLAGSVQPESQLPAWLGSVDRDSVTTAMSFFLLHQLASDGEGIAAVLRGWMEWFPNMRRLVIGDGYLLEAEHWTQQPWFSPTYEIYHTITGVRLWTQHEYERAFAELGWSVTRRMEDHTMLVTTILERG
ncbi:MAG: Diacylglycerol O-acyltransferase [Nocardia sp.]|uniref:class I SAM-dependent methyltransferase n=1 Tax=Nocardia sp. TaxID=1821 RepID=UPI002605BEF1|nr:class I SAM-dependent methyltransferase [Nocardia sp.]MCU1641304.1 Diacylglycerol O-acyltransferase [Nocardia sp.]